MKIQLAPGVVCEGSLKLDYLLSAFATELSLHAASHHAKLIRKSLSLAKILRHEHYQLHVDEAHELIEALSSALNDLCPPNHYFGAHEGDGACFGVWLGSADQDNSETIGDANASA